MALSLLAAARPVAGSASLVLLRLGIVVLATLPVEFLARRSLEDVGSQPFFTDVEGPLPLLQLIRLFEGLSSAWLAAAALGAVVAILANQWLTAGALEHLAPRARGASRSLFAVLRESGRRYLGAFLVVMLLALLLSGVGIWGVRTAGARIALIGERAGWSAQTLWLLLPTLEILIGSVWLATVGAWSLWCRVLVVESGGRLRLAHLTGMFPIWRRRPGGAPIFFVTVTLGIQIFGGFVLVFWRQRAPEGPELFLVWSGLWLLVMALHACCWHWLIRASLELRGQGRVAGYSEPARL